MSTKEQMKTGEPAPSLPSEELKVWIRAHYNDEADAYARNLKNAHIKAVEEKNVLALEKLSNVLFVTKSFLQKSSPEEYAYLTDIYARLKQWLQPQLEKLGK